MIGTQLAHYEITAKLGEGGMGVVYKAKDFHLGREVALKVLPEALTADPERTARFEREAKLLASLNHPNIAQIYGIEASGDSRALVMELVEGPTLAERLEKGSLPLNESLSIARQIADALQEAHEKGIVHRDLKPQNIKASIEGRVKVLDFGLAKATEAKPASAVSLSELARSPTITLGATREGVILGTAAYMSPEQARGMAVDKRADLWAFGVVLYEMLTGRSAFAAATVPDTLVAVLTREADLSLLPNATPAAVRRLLRRCLQRDPEARLRDIGDARLELDDAEAGAPDSALAGTRDSRSRRFLVAGAAALGVLAGSAWALWWSGALDPSPVTTRRAVRFEVPPPTGAIYNFSGRDAGPVAFSPDGTRLAFAATDAEGKKRLYVRRLDRLAADPLAGTEGATYPFWSADGRHLGFFAGGKLRRTAADGGPVQVLADAALGRGGAWNRDGVILFAPSAESPLFRVPAAGGAVSPATELGRSPSVTSHRWPSFLPDGRRFLYVAFSTVLSGPDAGHAVHIGSLDSGEDRLLLRSNAKAEYAAPGYLLFTRQSNLLAAPFDHDALRLTGEPIPLGQDVQIYPNTASALFSGSQDGAVVYASGASPPISQLVWFDRRGVEVGTVGEPIDCEDPRLSPDGERIAVNRIDARTGMSNIWIFDSASDAWSRFTFAPTFEHGAIWSPDGSRIAFDSFRRAPADVFVKALAGGEERPVVEGDEAATPTDWSADGRTLFVQRLHPESGWDLWTASPDGEKPPTPFLATPFNEEDAQLSPDGRWLAYTSDESGRREVYVVEFPELAGKWQVSTTGGAQPRWRRDGRELFYLAADRALMAVGVAASARFAASQPERLFETRARYTGYRAYDVSPDGRRFLVNTVRSEGGTSPLTVVLGWPSELGR